MSKGVLTDIGTEELAHLEIVGTLVHQLTVDASARDFDRCGTGDFYVDHDAGLSRKCRRGALTAAYIQVKGDPITDLTEDMAAEQKARSTYENILRLSDDPDVNEVIKFLRAREIVHFQRFGEVLNHVQSKINQKKFYQSKPMM